MKTRDHSIIRRLIPLFLAVVAGAFMLSSCGAPEEVKQAAQERLEKYEQPFRDKVAAVYGEDAELKKVECPTLTSIGSPVPDVSYKVSTELTGKIVLDGETYDAEYYPEEDKLMDTVNTEMICRRIVNCLPLDQSQFCGTKFTDSSYRYPMFMSGADSFEKGLAFGLKGNSLIICVITTEDITSVTEDMLTGIPDIMKLEESDIYYTIRIVSLRDTGMASPLQGKIQEIPFTYSDSHPNVYNSQTGGYSDAFEYYHIRSTIEIASDQVDGKKEKARVVMTR